MVGEDGESHDRELVAAMARGEHAALAGLFDRYAGRLLAIAVHLTGERRRAEDLVHDVLLEAWAQARAFDPSRGTVRSWLFLRLRHRAADRLALAQLRRTGADREPVEGVGHGGTP